MRPLKTINAARRANLKWIERRLMMLPGIFPSAPKQKQKPGCELQTLRFSTGKFQEGLNLLPSTARLIALSGPNSIEVTEQQKNRSTRDVLEHHLQCRAAGNLEKDIRENYSPDVVLLCEHGVLHGLDAIRKSGERLAEQLPKAQFHYDAKEFDGEYAYLQWRAKSPTAVVEAAADTFVIRDGRIVMQSVFYRLEQK
jgi:hypothetical protein